MTARQAKTTVILGKEWKDYGDLSAVEPQYSRLMFCNKCSCCWRGCWDNFQCPECGDGELPGEKP